jgi:hypothetical protein
MTENPSSANLNGTGVNFFEKRHRKNISSIFRPIESGLQNLATP